MQNIFDGTFNGMGASEMYRSWVMPELFQGPLPILENWPEDDLVAYVGGEYAKAAYAKSLR